MTRATEIVPGDSDEATIRIGSRGSPLALVQAELVRNAFIATGTAAAIVVIETAGDRRAPDSAWGEGAFVAAIERALLDGRVDVAVHSAKDVPTDEDARLWIAAYLPRADPRDALVVRSGASEQTLAELPAGARVGTDSPRRTAFLRALRPDLTFHPLHGNVDTRLRRLDAGDSDALVLACAGLDRLGRSDRITERLDAAIVPPAPGQGAIAVQVRAADDRLRALCEAIDHVTTRLAVEAERAFLHAAGGGCRAPIGALATVTGSSLELVGGHDRSTTGELVFGRRSGAAVEAGDIGRLLAADLGLGSGGTDSRLANGRPIRVIVGRARFQDAGLIRAMRAAGLEAVTVPAIEIDLVSTRPAVDRAARLLDTGRWVVVTSPNGARAIMEAAERVRSDVRTPRWAAIGSATRGVLEQHGVHVEFIPSRSSATALAAELPVAPGDHVLVLRADLAGDSLASTLRDRGAVVDDVIAYRTLEAPEASRPLLAAAFAAGPIDALVFTSGSTVRGLAALARDVAVDLHGIPAICIGDATATTAVAAGFEVIAVAPSADAQALADITGRALAGRRIGPDRQLQEIR